LPRGPYIVMHAAATVGAVVLLVLAAAALAWYFPPVRAARLRVVAALPRVLSGAPPRHPPRPPTHMLHHTPTHMLHHTPMMHMPHAYVHPVLPHHDPRDGEDARARADRALAFPAKTPARQSVRQQRYFHRPRPTSQSFDHARDSHETPHYVRDTPAVARHA